jgi:hypothetical protein
LWKADRLKEELVDLPDSTYELVEVDRFGDVGTGVKTFSANSSAMPMHRQQRGISDDLRERLLRANGLGV